MSASQTDLSAEKRSNMFQRFWQRLVEPHSSVTDVADRRQAQLLAALSLALALFFTFGAISAIFTGGRGVILFFGVAVLLGVYILSRTRYFQTGSLLIVLMIIGLAYLNILSGTDDPAGTLYSFIPFALILGSVLLPLPWMVGMVVATTVINFLLPMMFPSIFMRDIAAAAGSLMAQGALFIVVIAFRNSIERLRLSELSSANEELQKANIEVQQSTQRTRAMFTALPNGIGVTDLDGLFLEANESMARLVEVEDSAQLMGHNATEFIAPSDRERALQDFTSGAAVERSIEYRMCSAEGREFDGELTAATLTDEQDQPAGFVIVTRDITNRKRAAQAVQESQQLLQLVMDNIPQAVFWKDRDLVYLGANQAFAEDAGYESPEKIIGKTDFDFPWTEQASLYQADDQKVIAAGTAQLNYEEPQTGPTGETTWLRTSKVPVKDAVGNVIAVLGMYEDITAQKQYEQTLATQRHFLRQVIDSDPNFIFVKDRESRFVLVNQAIAEAYGSTPEGLIGKSDADFNPNIEEVEHFHLDDLEVIDGQMEKFIPEEQITTASGEARWLQTIKRPLVDDDGVARQLLGVATDISERKELEAQVQEAFERRGYQVQISTEISQEIAEASELNELFDQVVDLTKERLGYYHTQLLRYEPAQDAVVLISGYGEIGQKMVAEGHRMPMGSGLIGTAAATGETVLRPDLSEDPDWQPHPLLPDTRGEITVPIKLGDQVLGVLDVQSNQTGALTDDDRLMLEGLCGQIAIAIEQTRLRREMADRLDEINRLYRTMSREGWQAYQTSTTLPGGFEYDQFEIRPVDAKTSTQSMFAVPLTIPGGAVIGNLAIDHSPENPLTPEDQAFLQQISEQVALALDSARLFEQAQTRSEELDILNEMGRTLTSLQDEQAIYETIFEFTGKLMDTEIFYIATYDRERYEIEMPLLYEAGQMKTMPKQPAGNGLTNYIIQTRKPLLISRNYEAKVKELEIEQIVFGDTAPVASWLGVPLVFQDRIIGVVSVQSNTTPGLYTEHDRDLLTAIASQASVALENASVFRQTQQQAEYEAMINLISQRIQSTTSVENALQVTIRELGKALGAKRANVQLGLSKDK